MGIQPKRTRVYSHLVELQEDAGTSNIRVPTSMHGNQKPSGFSLSWDGGKICHAEILRSVRLGFTIVVIEGNGRFADEIATLYRNPQKFIGDPILAEIITDGKIHLFPLQGEVNELGRLVHKLYRQLRERYDTQNRLAPVWFIRSQCKQTTATF